MNAESRGLIASWSTFRVDIKLGLRMARKHWALTLIGGVSMTVAITIGASMFNLVQGIFGAELTLEEGDRVVILQPWNAASRARQSTSMDDFERWRRELKSVVDTGAYRRTTRNYNTAAGPAGPVSVAEMSAAGFRVARVAPHLGGFFVEDDERADAPPVVVIGEDIWRSHFSADPKAIGQRVQFDGKSHTVIGIMPDAFAFPIRDEFWTPLRATVRERATVFARLAAGASLERANAELESLGLLPSAAVGANPGRLSARVVPYIHGINGEPNPWLPRVAPVLFALLLLPPCINIAVLMYARTVARQGELAARTALGASRRRIVAQVFIEVLLLSAASAGAALVLALWVTDVLSYMIVLGNRAFWIRFGLSYGTILFAAAMALLAALIAGAIPALRATSRSRLAGGLHALSRSVAPRLGKTWTAVVVAQVALSVAVVPIAAEFAWNTLRPAILGPGFDASEFLVVNLEMGAGEDPSESAARFSAVRAEAVRQIEAEPGIVAVTMSESPLFEERDVVVEVDSPSSGTSQARNRESVAFNQVDGAFFDAFGIPPLAGRRFDSGDFQSNAVVVNRSFANRLLAGGNPLGRMVRRIEGNAPVTTYEIVGLVDDHFNQSDRATMYRPLSPLAGAPGPRGALRVNVSIHTGPTVPPRFENRLREIAARLDPAMRIDDLDSLDDTYFYSSLPEYIGASGLGGLALGIVLFSVAGIYTLLAFTVVQRRREIGIRSALGAPPFRLVLGIFRRVLIPVASGVAVGGVAAVLLHFYFSPLLLDGARPLPWILPATEAFILLVGVIAASGPTRRVLGADPVEALREI